MDVDEFERQYAERSDTTVQYLHNHGRYGRLCDCGEDDCKGWQMVNVIDEALFNEEKSRGFPSLRDKQSLPRKEPQ